MKTLIGVRKIEGKNRYVVGPIDHARDGYPYGMCWIKRERGKWCISVCGDTLPLTKNPSRLHGLMSAENLMESLNVALGMARRLQRDEAGD